MPAVSKRSAQKLSWNKAIAYDDPVVTSTRKAKSASSVGFGLSTGLQARSENNARATALQNKSNMMPNTRFGVTPMKKLGTTPLEPTMKKPSSKSSDPAIKKSAELKVPVITFDNGESFETYPPQEEMHLPPVVEDQFENCIPKDCRLDDEDLARIRHLGGFFMHSPQVSDDDDDDDWKLDVLSLPRLPCPIPSLKIDLEDSAEISFEPCGVVSDMEYSSDEEF